LPPRQSAARVPAPAARTVAAALAVVLLAACGATAPAVTAPDLTPVPGGASLSPGASFPPPTTQSVQDAIDRLDTLRSWRYTISQEGQDGAQGTSRGIVINDTPHRTRTDELSGTAVTLSTIEIGSQSWMSLDGEHWEVDPLDDSGGLPIDPGGTEGDWSNPLDGSLWVLTESPAAVVADLGLEPHGGVATRHLRVTVTGGRDAPVSDSTGMAFAGSAELWIAADRGYLVAARATGTTTLDGFDDNGNPTGSPDVAPFRIEIAVDGADDPANAVDEPVVPDPTPLPSGDPAVVGLVGGIRRAQQALDRYVITVKTASDETDAVVTSTVVNRPVPAVLVETSGPDGSGFLVIGPDAWSRDESGAWMVTARSEVPVCDSGDGTTTPTDAGDCSGLLASLMEPAEELAVTFERAGEETVDGIRTIHLHSDAGMGSGGMSLPGTTDIWVARDGGWLVRFVFRGSGVSYDVTTSRVNDPSIRLAPPPDAPSAP
jgi:hypothetical protein